MLTDNETRVDLLNNEAIATTIVDVLLARLVQGAVNIKCPNCGAAELVKDIRDLPYTYKGKSTVIPAVTGDFCSACGEGVLEPGESVRSGAWMLEFNKQVNATDAACCVRNGRRDARVHRGARHGN